MLETYRIGPMAAVVSDPVVADERHGAAGAWALAVDLS
jgi:hypothetical protein